MTKLRFCAPKTKETKIILPSKKAGTAAFLGRCCLFSFIFPEFLFFFPRPSYQKTFRPAPSPSHKLTLDFRRPLTISWFVVVFFISFFPLAKQITPCVCRVLDSRKLTYPTIGKRKIIDSKVPTGRK